MPTAGIRECTAVSLTETAEITASLSETEAGQIQAQKRDGNKAVEMLSICLLDDKGEEKELYRTGEKMLICVDYVNHAGNLRDVVFGFAVYRSDGFLCYGTDTFVDRIPVKLGENGSVRVTITALNLLPGVYRLDLGFKTSDDSSLDYWQECKTIQVSSDIQDAGVTRLDHSWNIS